MSIFNKIGRWAKRTANKVGTAVKRAGDLGLPSPDPASDAGRVAEKAESNQLPGESDRARAGDKVNPDSPEVGS